MFETLTKFFITGGFFMIPLGVCSVVTLAIMLERGFALRRSLVIKQSLARAIADLRYGDKTTLIEQLSSDQNTVLARLVRSCLLYMPWSKAENSEALQTKARAEVSQLERGLVFLEIVVGIGPLLGLLGTISGLITIFAHVADNGGLATQGMLIAKGISEALHTTVAGLVVAIPAAVAHSLYCRRVDDYSVELETICSDLLGKLYSEAEESVPNE
jgi:biopolymer transport protein ExbB